MALTDENGSNMVMPVAPMYGGGNNGFADCFGGSGWWILLLFILLGGNGWGGGFGGGFDGGLYPWMNQSNQINGGFRDQMIDGSINQIQSGINGISTQLCNGFAGVNASISNAAAQAEIAANGRQMANMNQMYGLQSQFADCCCENRLGLADLKYTVATENCADRTQSMQNTRDIIDSQTRSTQAILDKLCALELDGVKSQLAAAQRENVGLQNQLNMATMQASQVEQTAQLRASQATTANQLVAELRSCPIPSQPVYGNQPIFTCPQTVNSCGCGNNGF